MQTLKISLRLVAILCLLAASATSAASEWQAGVARIKITPEQPLLLSGKYQRNGPAEGTLHELWAKALAIQDAGGRRVVLVTMDLVGIDRDISQGVCADLNERYRLERVQVALATSHTHNGPVVGGNLPNMFVVDAAQQALIDQYAVTLRKNLVQVVGEALAAMSPCRLAWGIGSAGFAINRRNNSRSGIEDRIASGDFSGPFDHDVPVLSILDPQDRLQAVVFGYACHPIWLRHFAVWSGDYPGVAQARLEQAHPGAIALFWAGCGGDQNPVSRGGKLERAESQSALLPKELKDLAIDEVEYLGGRLAGAVEAVLAAKPTYVAGELDFRYRELDLPLANVPGRDQLNQDAQSSDPFVARRAERLLRDLDAGRPPRQSYPFPVQTWRLGERLLMVALGGETVVDYSLRIKQQLGADQTWVSGYTNDVMAYLPSRRVILEGGYEGGDSMVYYGLPAPWDPQIEESIVQTVAEQAGELRRPAAP